MTLAEVMVALVITGLTIAGTISGYIYCNTANMKEGLYMAANGRAMERMEEVRAARWVTSAYPVIDQLVTTNFPDQDVTLDKSGIGPEVVTGTLKTDISQISTNPSVKRIRVDCVWLFRGVELVTNTIETCRAAD
jgi:hypothetical protein